MEKFGFFFSFVFWLKVEKYKINLRNSVIDISYVYFSGIKRNSRNGTINADQDL